MLYHWMKLVWDENFISITSFVTRIASELGVLANAQVAFLPPDTPNLVTESHFIRAHFLRKNPSTDTYVMIYKGYNFEVPLPAPQFKIYHVDTLSMPLESVLEEEPLEEPRLSVARVMTRAQRRAAQERLQKQAQDAQTAGTGPTWFHIATGTSWQTQGTDPTWQPHGGSANTPWGHEPSVAFSQQ